MPRPLNAGLRIKRWIIQNPDMSVSEIRHRFFKTTGIELSSFLASQIRSNFLDDIRYLDRQGLLKPRPIWTRD